MSGYLTPYLSHSFMAFSGALPGVDKLQTIKTFQFKTDIFYFAARY